MSWTEVDVSDQSGKVVIVTGANGGLGLENTRVLAARGALVIMASRNQEKALAAVNEIRDRHPEASLEIRSLDLVSIASIESFAASVLEDFDHVDILINNAGVMAIPERITEDGYEMQLATNHLGHYVLTARLLPLLVRTAGSRVVSVTSTARHFGRPIDPDNPHMKGRYSEWAAYGQSKLANLHFAVGLEDRFRTAGAETRSLVAHPGLSTTDLQPNSARETKGGGSQRIWEWLAAQTGMTPAVGALSQLRAATDPAAKGGQLYAPRWVNWGPPVRRPLMGRSRSQRAIETLFQVSERETGVALDVATSMAKPSVADPENI